MNGNDQRLSLLEREWSAFKREYRQTPARDAKANTYNPPKGFVHAIGIGNAGYYDFATGGFGNPSILVTGRPSTARLVPGDSTSIEMMPDSAAQNSFSWWDVSFHVEGTSSVTTGLTIEMTNSGTHAISYGTVLRAWGKDGPANAISLMARRFLEIGSKDRFRISYVGGDPGRIYVCFRQLERGSAV